MKITKNWLFIIPIGFMFVFPVIIYIAQAQVEPTDRFFEKDFCASETTLLDGVNYTNGDELSYSSSGCPVSMKTIHRWNELGSAQQILITSRLNANGYDDVTAQVLAQVN